MAPLLNILSLGFTDTEYLSSAGRAFPLSGWTLILHGNRLGVFDFNLFSALHTIRLHHFLTSLLVRPQAREYHIASH